jgi:hypothetical protein
VKAKQLVVSEDRPSLRRYLCPRLVMNLLSAPVLLVASLSLATGDDSAMAASNAASPFRSSSSTVSAGQLGATWRPGCPVAPGQLRLLHLNYVGFDNHEHVGTIVVRTRVVASVIKIFFKLFLERFPIHSMIPESRFAGHDPTSMAADNTSGFNCRYAVASGTPQWSAHAFGEAIDVNPIENPYLVSGVAEPVAGKVFLNRNDVRRGMAVKGGELVTAFTSVGWYWGGRWTASPDYQHFSVTGG